MDEDDVAPVGPGDAGWNVYVACTWWLRCTSALDSRDAVAVVNDMHGCDMAMKELKREICVHVDTSRCWAKSDGS